MPIDPALLEVRDYTSPGYRPLVDYGAWRVALLNYIDELLPERLDTMQRHDETDEVFVLLSGRCLLFLGEGEETVWQIDAEDMQPLKLYNVKRGAWHTHTLSREASVLIVENRDTTDANSPRVPLGEAQRRQIVELTRRLWR
jgi:hypothetical protein